MGPTVEFGSGTVSVEMVEMDPFSTKVLHRSRLGEVKHLRDGIKDVENAWWWGWVIVEHEDNLDVNQIGQGQLGRGNDAKLGVVVVVLSEGADSVQQCRRLRF